ncbi:MAG: hypothetical protein JNJ54_29835 [Myxococcaceae bacterium]|nr:hypothetical protein [Myxococcaceae bacterium]
MSPRLPAPALWLLLASVVACAPTFPLEYRLENLRADSQKWPGEALAHYASRPQNDLTACTTENLRRTDDALVDPFVAALEAEPTVPDRWATCALTLLPTLPAPSRARMLERLARLTVGLAEQSDARRLEVVHRVLAGRPRERSETLEALRGKLKKVGANDPRARAALEALDAVLELDEGLLDGTPLTADRVFGLSDERVLRRIGARSLDDELRAAARRRLIRLHLATSSFREVKERASEVEEAVFQTGRWAQPLAALPMPVAQPALPLPAEVRASQDIAGQRVRLSTDLEGAAARRIDVRPFLRFAVGWSQSLPLCASPDALDVTPCIDAREVHLGAGVATLEPDGTLLVPEFISMMDLVDLTRAGFGLVAPVEVAGRAVQVLQVPLTVLHPAPFFFEGPTATVGPAVNVTVVPVTQALLVEAVDASGVRKQLVLPRGASSFEFGSRGGAGIRGRPGSAGLNGSTGSSGMSASCPSMSGGTGGRGGNGTPGGTGGPGGPGGDGGLVKVEFVCGQTCGDEALVRAVFRSRGGPGGEGGPGGKGGSGGAGGSGGMGTSCYSGGRTTSLSGGSAGPRGSDGANGSQGPRGAPGHDGLVQVLLR